MPVARQSTKRPPPQKSAWSRFKSWMIQYDSFGEPVTFYYPGERKDDNFKSLFGSCLSITMLIVTFSLAGITFL